MIGNCHRCEKLSGCAFYERWWPCWVSVWRRAVSKKMIGQCNTSVELLRMSWCESSVVRDEWNGRPSHVVGGVSWGRGLTLSWDKISWMKVTEAEAGRNYDNIMYWFLSYKCRISHTVHDVSKFLDHFKFLQSRGIPLMNSEFSILLLLASPLMSCTVIYIVGRKEVLGVQSQVFICSK